MSRSIKGPRLDTGRVPLTTRLTGGKRIALPCGRCVGCRLERSRQWASRIVLETQSHQSNLFITLTYRDDALTYGVKPNGDQTAHGVLIPRHLELFWKRLRKWFGHRIGYYACGEYGDKSSRPHYHACVFGLVFEDKTVFEIKDGNTLYHSRTLDSLWTHGHCYFGDVTFESAAYVARYCMKKSMGKDRLRYERDGITPEFARMSRRPAIGKNWFETYGSDVFPADILVVRGVPCKPPRYFFDLLSRANLNVADDVKMERIAKAKEFESESDRKRLMAREKVKLSAIKSLTRRLD